MNIQQVIDQPKLTKNCHRVACEVRVPRRPLGFPKAPLRGYLWRDYANIMMIDEFIDRRKNNLFITTAMNERMN